MKGGDLVLGEDKDVVEVLIELNVGIRGKKFILEFICFIKIYLVVNL